MKLDKINMETALDKCDSMGGSIVNVYNTNRIEKRNMINMDRDLPNKLKDYIFGNTTENPFESYNEKITAKIDENKAVIDMLVQKVKKSKNKRKINK